MQSSLLHSFSKNPFYRLWSSERPHTNFSGIWLETELKQAPPFGNIGHSFSALLMLCLSSSSVFGGVTLGLFLANSSSMQWIFAAMTGMKTANDLSQPQNLKLNAHLKSLKFLRKFSSPFNEYFRVFALFYIRSFITRIGRGRKTARY